MTPSMRVSAPVTLPKPSDKPARKPYKARGRPASVLPDPASDAESGSHRDLAVGLDDGRAVSGPLHGSTPLLRGSERVVCLAHRDDLAVAGLQQEPELGQQAWGHSESMLPCQRERC